MDTPVLNDKQKLIFICTNAGCSLLLRVIINGADGEKERDKGIHAVDTP